MKYKLIEEESPSKFGKFMLFFWGMIVGILMGASTAFIIITSNRHIPAIQDTRVLTMTPEQFSSRCGRLISDKLSHGELDLMNEPKGAPDKRTVIVRLTLPGGEQKKVAAVFWRDKSGWSLSSVGGYDADPGPLGGLKTIKELYPCTTK